MSKFFHYLLIKVSFLLHRPLCGPFIGTIIVTYKCNFSCRMCDFASNKDKDRVEMTTLEMKQLIKSFAGLGVAGIGFTGGEPLLRSDIFELLKYAKDQKVITHLNTNGYLLDKDAGRKIIETGIDSVNISLDAASAEVHDAIRGVGGAFDKALNAISCLIDARYRYSNAYLPRIKVVSVIGADNVREVSGLLRLSDKLNIDSIEFVPLQHFSANCGVSYGDDFFVKLKIAVSLIRQAKKTGTKIENSWKNIELFAESFSGKKSPLTCYSGYNSCCVDCYGNIYPCVPWANWRKQAGNIKASGLEKVWYSEKYNKLRNSVSKCRDCYLNCHTELNQLFNLP